jgi:hypothetical protein
LRVLGFGTALAAVTIGPWPFFLRFHQETIVVLPLRIRDIVEREVSDWGTEGSRRELFAISVLFSSVPTDEEIADDWIPI